MVDLVGLLAVASDILSGVYEEVSSVFSGEPTEDDWADYDVVS